MLGVAFRHHPDGFLLIGVTALDMAEFAQIQQTLTLPSISLPLASSIKGLAPGEVIIGREYIPGERHSLYTSAGRQVGGVFPWPQGDTITDAIDAIKTELHALRNPVATLSEVKASSIQAIQDSCRANIYGGFTSSALGSAHQYPCKGSEANPDQRNMEGSVTESVMDRQNASAWSANDASVAVGDYKIVAGEVLEAVSVSGATGSSAPAVPAVGSTVVDGGVTWKRWSTPFWVKDPATGTWSFTDHTEKQIQKAGKDMKAFILAARLKCGSLVDQMNQVAAWAQGATVTAGQWCVVDGVVLEATKNGQAGSTIPAVPAAGVTVTDGTTAWKLFDAGAIVW